MLSKSALRAHLSASIPLYSNGTRRLFSATSPTTFSQKLPDSASTPINPRWLTMAKRRVGKCMMFGMKPAQIDEGGRFYSNWPRNGGNWSLGARDFSRIRNGAQGHVNNVTYVRYAETARVNWTRNIGNYIDTANKKEWINMLGSTGIGLILKSIKVDYKFVLYP
ncbi:hypothetical protein N7519_004583 [Penicillium mononematosum]|uniref:uncharacterized protein n=1 Tax=Penicillium mononematosum TaxID=268346 RepID=UPI0025488DA0|nr:uncharacterized protein N7519_004583 [Penicillium mononematosum]KAJ6189675.1 hypothetical protein N7519_004583 [Penicillium mononematosum]